ncbi:MAG: hypothetical protein QM802_01275 [Agriterribacter sp.]
MKKLLVSAAAIVMAISSINAQTQDEKVVKNDIKTLKKQERSDKITLRKMEGNDASYQSKEQFRVDFGDVAEVSWGRSGYYDEAVFTKDGKSMKAFYDPDAHLVGTVTAKTFNDLPKDAQKDITKRYKDYTVDKVIFYDDNESNETDMILYGSQFDDADNYFVELSKGTAKLVLQIQPDGNVSFFKQISK